MVFEQVLPAWVPTWAINPAKLVTVLILAYLTGRYIVKPVTAKIVERRAEHLEQPLSRVAMYLTVIAGFGVALSVAGYKSALGAVGTILGAGTLAVGLAMKDTIAAVVAGVFIFLDKPFKIGDTIAWEDHEGTVEDIRLRTTKVLTFDNEVKTVPNDQIANAIVTNLTAKRRRRITMPVGIGYEDDIDEAKELLRDMMVEHDAILANPAPIVRLNNLGDSTVDLKMFFWVKNKKRPSILTIKEDLLYDIKTTFDDRGIDMPYPTTTIAGSSITVKNEDASPSS